MYASGYGDQNCGGALFSNLPEQTRVEMVDLDYSLAEKRCPQKIAIGQVMRMAAKKWGC